MSSCFATKTIIPFFNVNHATRVFSVLIDNHIWILFKTRDDLDVTKWQFYKFNTETYQIEVINCLFPYNFYRLIPRVTNDQHYIYLFAKKENVTEFGRHEISMECFKFNITTLQWEFVTSFPRAARMGPVSVVDNQLYYLKKEPDRKSTLMRVNLISMNSEEIQVPHGRGIGFLMKHDGQIYAHLTGEPSSVYCVNTGELEISNSYPWQDEEQGLWRPNIRVINGELLSDIPAYRDGEPTDATCYLDLFNFTTNSWNRKVLPGFIRKDTEPHGDLIVSDDKLLTVFEDHSRRNEYSIRMYEVVPQLSTICMMNLIDRSNDAAEIEPIFENLSVPLRHKLENMMKWRIPENIVRLAKEQNTGVVEEIRRMEDDGLVDHRMQRKLRTAFDSDFSDQSGSDIMDSEDEPLEELDDENARRRNKRRDPDDEREMWD